MALLKGPHVSTEYVKKKNQKSIGPPPHWFATTTVFLKEKTEGLDTRSLHRSTFVCPILADSGVPEKVLPFQEVEIENPEPESDIPSESLQFPDMTNRDPLSVPNSET